MKFYILTTIAFFFITLIPIQAQKKHEVKIGINRIFKKEFNLFYELILNEKTGIEFGANLDMRDRLFITLNPGINMPMRYSQTDLELSFAMRRYVLLNNKYANGLYLGPYLRMKYFLSLEEEFADRYQEIYQQEPSPRRSAGPGIRSIDSGINLGYKWIIRSNYIIDFHISNTLNIAVGPFSSSAEINKYVWNDVQGKIKFGYRFN